jgi:hypothetical protein
VAESADSDSVTPAIDADREALVSALVEHGVEFVLIGGAAIQSYGRQYDTQDVDVVPDADEANLDRLASVLNRLECRLVTDPADLTSWVRLPGDYFTPRTLRAATVWNVATRYGQLDVTFAPSGFAGGYKELAPRAQRRPLAGTSITVAIASLEDIHESKRQADRPKDREYFRQADDPNDA